MSIAWCPNCIEELEWCWLIDSAAQDAANKAGIAPDQHRVFYYCEQCKLLFRIVLVEK